MSPEESAPKQPRYAGYLMILTGALSGWNVAGLGTLALVGCFIWSRSLRPFSKSVSIGYWLCWLDVTFFSAFSATAEFTYLGMSTHWEYQVLAYLVSAAIWLPICVKFMRRPAHSIGQAFLTALGGGLFLGAALVQTDLAVHVMPTIVALPWLFFVKTQYDQSWVRIPIALAPGAVLFLVYLVVYWPVRTKEGEE